MPAKSVMTKLTTYSLLLQILSKPGKECDPG